MLGPSNKSSPRLSYSRSLSENGLLGGRACNSLCHMDRFTGVLGIVVLLFTCWRLSTERRRIDWRLVISGLLLQLVFALIILKTSTGKEFFAVMNDAVVKFLDFSQEGSSFVFGNLSQTNIPIGVPQPGQNPKFAELSQASELWARGGSYFAFGVLPTVIFFSLIMSVLYHLGIMQWIVWLMAWVMQKTLRTRGAETLSAAANIFLGQTEAPLMIKPYLPTMSNSELLAIMVGGMANVAGGVLAAYVGMLSPRFPDIAGHLMAASVMSAPASLLIAKMLMPLEQAHADLDEIKITSEKIDVNVLDAATRGVSEGVQLVLNIAGMLIGFIALVALVNYLWGLTCGTLTWLTHIDLTRVDSFQEILGFLFSPIAWLIGVPPQDCLEAGALLGEKTILNEFIAYGHMADYLNGRPLLAGIPVHELHDKTKVVLAYALCGFANISSIGILLGGMGSMAPNRRGDLAKLGIRALIGGTIATFMTASIAGVLL